jgi:hypothetical protein
VGSAADPDPVLVGWIRIQEGKNAKINHKNRKECRSVGFSLLRVEGFSFSWDVLYRGLGISKFQLLIMAILIFFICYIFQFLVIKTSVTHRGESKHPFFPVRPSQKMFLTGTNFKPDRSG